MERLSDVSYACSQRGLPTGPVTTNSQRVSRRRSAAPPAVFFALIALTGPGCGGPRQAQVGPQDQPHLGEAWFPYRAQSLGLTVEAAKARDAALSLEAPPEVLGPRVMKEAAALWLALCAACHGPRGQLEGVSGLEPMPRKWGTMGASMGFFFGGDKMRAGIYRTIAEGKQDEQGQPVMPAWSAALSREQIWALVRHIEGF